MRAITAHKTNPANEEIELFAVDGRGPGNANHEYVARWKQPDGYEGSQGVKFQNGPIKEFGINGITNEALIAIVLDRLRGFQAGDFKCRENALAITNIEQGLLWLNARTKERTERGVEGTHVA